MRTTITPGFAVEELARLVAGRLLSGNGEDRCRAVSTDTRTLEPGDFFVALTGPNFDGHNFFAEAMRCGAGGAIVEEQAGRRLLAEHATGKPVLGVRDPLAALQTMARAHRGRFALPVIAITGSNGKTTTKEMTAAVLSGRYRVHKTVGNLNNQIGLPMTLLGLTDRHSAAVYELGMSHRGELTELCAMATPTIGIITNIGRAHVEYLGDVEGVRAAKAELLDGLPPDGVAVLNCDDAAYEWLRSRCRCRCVTFGFSPGADVRVSLLELQEGPPPRQRLSISWAGGGVEAAVSVLGWHNALNAAAAVAASQQIGVEPADIAAGLEAVSPAAMRSEWRQLPGGVQLLLDAYNANPSSMKRALEVAGQLAPGRVTAFLGDMLELGPLSERWHREVGAEVVARGLRRLVAVGSLAAAIADGAVSTGMASGAVHRCADVDAARALLRRWLRSGELCRGDLVLIKGSRAMRMEGIIDALDDAGGAHGTGGAE